MQKEREELHLLPFKNLNCSFLIKKKQSIKNVSCQNYEKKTYLRLDCLQYQAIL